MCEVPNSMNMVEDPVPEQEKGEVGPSKQKTKLNDLLVCPECGETLTFDSFGEDYWMQCESTECDYSCDAVYSDEFVTWVPVEGKQ